MIDFKFLERLADLLKRSDVATIEIRKRFWSTSIKISKASPDAVTYQVASNPHGSSAPAPAPAEEVGGVAESSGSKPSAPTAEPAAELVDVKSPMVGTFYAQPEPGADPYVQVGSRVRPGDTLCIIEAMKIMNPLDAEVAGVIKEINVEDSQPVEFGQVLFRVDPNG